MSGAEQSPIDLRHSIHAAIGPLDLSWKLGPVEIENHETILFLDNGFMKVGGVRYNLVKGHMHRPSEHTLNGHRFATEIHLVHEAADKQLAVVGIFVVARQRKSKAFELLMRDGPGEFDPNTLLPPPDKRHYDRYQGSLTTPPFSEIVTWSVLVTPISAAQNQLELVPEHARELWPKESSVRAARGLSYLYPSPVPAQLHVHTAEARAPERAARLITAELLRSFPRQRPVTLAVVALAPHAGLTPTPWLLDGVFTALTEAERTPVNFVTIGDHETAEALLRKAGSSGPIRAPELIERPSRDRIVQLRAADHRQPLRLLRELVGSSLIICAPLCLAARDEGPTRQWQGPLASVFAALAHDHGFSPSMPKPTAAVAVGHELLGASFASATLILDATWAAALEPGHASSASGRTRGPDGRFQKVSKLLRATESAGPTLLGELASTERILAVPELSRTSLAALLGVDRFLAGVLGLDTRSSEHVPELAQSPGRWPHLQVTAPRSQPKRLADRAIAGMRSQAARFPGGAEPAALPARVPGEFAQLWTRRWYGEHDLGRQRPRVELR